MALTKDQSISLYGTEAYTGWGETEAAADAAAHPEKLNGFSGYAPSISVDDYIQTITDTLPAPPEEYLKANPFYFDEQAARDVSAAEYTPYYQEILSDYMTDVKMVADKNQGDYGRILADLDKQKELFLSQNKMDFDKLIRGIKEGYSTKGLYFSGTNQRTQAEAGAENTNKIESYLNTYGSKTGQAGDEFKYAQQQQGVDVARRQRDIGREQEASILGGIQSQKNEALDEYLYGMQTYYKNPNWKTISDVGNTLQKQGVQI